MDATTPTALDWSGTLSVRLLSEAVDGDYEAKKITIPRVGINEIPLYTASNEISKKKDCSNNIIPFENVLNECTHVTFDVKISNFENKSIEVHLNRNAEENVADALQRLGLSIAKKRLKRTIKKGNSRRKSPNVTYSVVSQNREQNLLKSHPKVWEWQTPTEQEVLLTIDSVNVLLKVDCCPPTIVSVETFENFRQHLFVGVPIVVLVDTIFSFMTTVDWYVDGQNVQVDSDLYTPVSADIGKEVMVVVTVFDQNHRRHSRDAYRFLRHVQMRPHNAVLDFRDNFIKTRCNEQKRSCIRVLTYNILNANESDYPHCDSKFIVKERRIPLVLFEILQYKADIISLQEVDESTYKTMLAPICKRYGYQGFYGIKENSREGCAMFWLLNAFFDTPENEYKNHLIGSFFDRNKSHQEWNSMNDIFRLFDAHENLETLMCERLSHVLQTAHLTHKESGNKLLVANTHLFFHPKASHVRLIQLYACLYQLDKERTNTSKLVLCGDLNSSPSSGAARLLWHRVVEPPDGETDQGTTWKHLCTFSWDRQLDNFDEASDGANAPTISLPEKFPSLISAYQTLPECTHYIHNFAATLDYIMVSGKDWTPVSSAKVPPKAILSKDIAMPSEVLPSDHVSLVCDLEFKKK